jgi:hypothetical protein
MTEQTCSEVGEVACEYALGTLSEREADGVRAHLEQCVSCWVEMEELRSVCDQLVQLLPAVEPPTGFERRALSAMGVGRRRRMARRWTFAIAGLAAVTAAAVPASVGAFDRRTVAGPANLAGVFFQGRRDVGSVEVGGKPLWVSMTVSGLSVTGPVSCQLVSKQGTVRTVGSFELVDGSGSWGARESLDTQALATARLVTPAGVVVAVAGLGEWGQPR